MTISYSLDISTANASTVFKLLLRWRGSVFKTLCREGLAYFSVFTAINLTYRLALNKEQKVQFESVAAYCEKYMGMIPTTFILGFYVSIVFTRWSYILNNLPWPDTPGMFIGGYITGTDKRAIVYRRTINRYLITAQVMAFRDISMQVRKRFPTMQHVVDCGLLTNEEMIWIDDIKSAQGDPKYWMPIQWAIHIVMKARTKGFVPGDHFADSLTFQINEYRRCIGNIMVADGFCIPLVYTQVVTLAVWTYFIASLMARQVWHPSDSDPDHTKELDLYVPTFTILQFICLVGWLKVAQDMLNPLGEADDDFELNALIDRNIQVGFLMMDDNAQRAPPIHEDAFIDEDEALLPHTEASLPTAEATGFMPSAFEISIPEKEQVMVPVGSKMSSTRSSNHTLPTAHVGLLDNIRQRFGSRSDIDHENGNPTSPRRNSITRKNSQLGERLLSESDEVGPGVDPHHLSHAIEAATIDNCRLVENRMATVLEEEEVPSGGSLATSIAPSASADEDEYLNVPATPLQSPHTPEQVMTE